MQRNCLKYSLKISLKKPIAKIINQALSITKKTNNYKKAPYEKNRKNIT